MKKNISRKKRRYVVWFKRVVLVLLGITLIFLARELYTFITKPPYVSPVPAIISRITQTSDLVEKKEALVRLLQEKKIAYTAIAQANDKNVQVIILPDESHVVVTLQKDLSVQVSSLQLILSRLTIEGKRFSRLDVRYNKPVIVFK